MESHRHPQPITVSDKLKKLGLLHRKKMT